MDSRRLLRVDALRPEIKRRFPALPIERHGLVLVRGHPLAVDLAVASGRAYPHVDLRSAGLRSTVPVETVAEGYVIIRRDTQAAHLEANRVLE